MGKSAAGRSSAIGEQQVFKFVNELSDVPCSRCGAHIRTVYYPLRDIIESEYMNAQGQCWKCATLAGRPVAVQ